MGKKKLIRFVANQKFACLFEPPAKELMATPHELRGRWCQDFFGNENELVVEIGCGRGEYALGLARVFPKRNFLGIDIKGSRLFHGAKEVNEEKLTNVGFIRSQIDFIDRIFSREVDEIWITFPDPYAEKPRKRLTSPVFLNRYLQILKPDGIVSLKTDDSELFNFTRWIAEKNHLKILRASEDIYAEGQPQGAEAIQTTYERKFLQLGKGICLLKFVLDKKILPLDEML